MMRTSKAAAGLKLAAAAGMAAALALAGPGGVAPAAPAQTPGQACLFSAPYGAVPNGGLVGHIGWGYEDTNGEWTFGATEGVFLQPIVLPGFNTNSWMSTGKLSDMLTAFGMGTDDGKGPSYYLQYRCGVVSDSNPSAALAAAQQEADNGYNLIDNNCLTKAVAILQAYQVPSLPDVVPKLPYMLPNFYFNDELPSSFGSVQYFTTLTVGAKVVDPLNNDYVTMHPLHTTRPMRIQIRVPSGKVVYDSGFGVTARVTANTDRYQATVQLPSPSLLDSNLETWAGPDAYTLEVELATTPGDMRGLTLPSSETIFINQAAANTAPDISLYVGDINGDGYVDINDYDLLLQCFSDIAPPKGPCDSGLKAAADIDDDGKVDGTDYNELLRVFACLRHVTACG
jgi:Dockerin type I domain